MFKNPFSFNGRIRRTEFGISYVLFIFCFYMFLFMIEELNLGGFQVAIILCAGYWFLIAQSAKRCHDLGNNGFYQLIPFYLFALIFSEGQSRANIYGQDPKLLELYDREGKNPSTGNKLIFPEEKTLLASGSEMFSGIMITALCIGLLQLFISTGSWFYFIVESLFFMAGYFTVLNFSFHQKPLPNLPVYFVVHRAVFSLVLYVVIWIYELYSKNITNLNFAAIWGDIIYISSFFLLTFIPLHFYKRWQKPNIILIEA